MKMWKWEQWNRTQTFLYIMSIIKSLLSVEAFVEQTIVVVVVVIRSRHYQIWFDFLFCRLCLLKIVSSFFFPSSQNTDSI